jgi:hypothetical protein
MLKILMCIQKKLQRLTNKHIVLTSVGGLASLMALCLFFPGLIAFRCQHESKVRNLFVAEETFVEVDFEVTSI